MPILRVAKSMILAAAAACVLFPSGLGAQPNVLTHHYDNARSGLNANETILEPSTLNADRFGKLFSYPVDGAIYAQPLYVQDLTIPGKGRHNVVFVATENNSVYAFDADPIPGAKPSPLWHVSVIDRAHGARNGAVPVSSSVIGCPDIAPMYGITATPAIDLPSHTMYLNATSMEDGAIVHRLHALDIATGAEKAPGPVVIQPTAPAQGDSSANGGIAFAPERQGNRAGLLLLDGTVYVAFAGYCDLDPYHGWLLAYDARTLKEKAVFVSTPNGSGGGIWMSGAGVAADSKSNIYLVTGNGDYDGELNFGDSVLRLGPTAERALDVLDWFTPYNQADLSDGDLDQGSGGVLLIPDLPSESPRPHLLLTGGKDGTMYLLDRDNLGRFNPGDNHQVWQSLPAVVERIWGVPAWWNNSVYLTASGDTAGGYLRAFSLDRSTGLLSSDPSSRSAQTFGFPAPMPVISANGFTGGIVWLLQTDGYAKAGPAILRAYDATNLANELYNSAQQPTRDNPGPAVKFTVPVVANGKVYVGTQTHLSVFGKLPAGPSGKAAGPASTPGAGPPAQKQ